MGCVRPSGEELELLDLLDILWNLCVARGGWRITAVLAMSTIPASITLEDNRVIPGRGYPDECRGVETSHPIDLACEGRQRQGVDRVLDASRVLRDMVIAMVMAAAPGAKGERLEKLIRGAYDEVYFNSDYFSDEDSRPVRAYPWTVLTAGVDKTTAAEAASAAARANGSVGGRLGGGDGDHDYIGGVEE